MENFSDYSMMFSVLEKWTAEKFKSELKRYNEKKDEIYKQYTKLQDQYRTLQRNTDYFEKRIKEMYLSDLEKKFVLKPEHKRILQSFDIHFDGENGGARTDGLRYLYDNYIKIVFEKDKYELSEKEIDNLYLEFEKLMDEIPFAIKKLSE